MICLTKLGYELICDGKTEYAYSVQGEALPKAYKLKIEINDETGASQFRCEPILIGAAIRGVCGEMQQFVVFTKDGVLIKRMGEFRFSYIKRPLTALHSRSDKRRVVPTKEEQEMSDYIDRHAYEIKLLLEQDNDDCD